MIVTNYYWTNFDETLHVGWDCLSYGRRKVFELISNPNLDLAYHFLQAFVLRWKIGGKDLATFDTYKI